MQTPFGVQMEDFPSATPPLYNVAWRTSHGGESNMSLVLAIKVDAGAVLASDSRVSNPEQFYADRSTKIYELTDRIGIGHAGDAYIGCAITEHLQEKLKKNRSAYLKAVNKDIVQWAKTKHEEMIALPVGRQEVREVNLLLVGFIDAAQRSPLIVRMNSRDSYVMTTPAENPRYATIGPDACALPFLNNCISNDMPLSKAQAIAALCIQQTAANLATVGGPIQMLVAHDGKVGILSSESIKSSVEEAQSADWSALLP